MRSFHDLQGNEVALGRFLGRGGEGAVYSVPTRPRLVAKIYARTPRDPMGHKLAAMVQVGTEQLTALTAWPQDLLLDESTGSVVGFLMPRVEDHRGIHVLYGPTTRKTAFPGATWAFLVRTARNVAAVFDAVHRHGHVIGDVNEGNVVVSPEATVRLIDCDSFQITHLGRTYPCRVGVPLYTPPELQGQRLEDIVRTPDHDRFGLAVLVFQLLFMGRHPFAGLHPRRDILLGIAIRDGLFAFGQEGARQGWAPPPFSLWLAEVSVSVAALFDRAFGKDAAAGGLRPTAADWLTALGDLEAMTVICAQNPRHVHATAHDSCPWCRIEKDGGPSFFSEPRKAAAARINPVRVEPDAEKGRKAGRFDEAIALYRELVADNPRDRSTMKLKKTLFRGYILKALMNLARGRFDEAFQGLLPVVDRLVEDGEGEKAAALLQQIVQRDPDHVDSLVKLVEVYRVLGREGPLATTYQLLREAFIRRGLMDQAASVLETLVQMDPQNRQQRSKL